MTLICHPHQQRRITAAAIARQAARPIVKDHVAGALRPDLVRPLREVERDAIETALILCGGNRGLAAQKLAVPRSTLYRWIRAFKAENCDQAPATD